MLFALALGACKPGLGPSGRAPVLSCPGGASVATRFHDHVPGGAGAGEIGEAGGVTWVLGTVELENLYQHALAHLDPAGSLVITLTPGLVDFAAVQGDRIWLFTAFSRPRWRVVDVRDPEAPVFGAEVPLKLAGTDRYTSGFAVGSRRAVLVQDPDLVAVDTATGVAVAPPQALPEPWMSTLHVACADDRCMAIGEVDVRERRRIVVVRVGADGSTEAAPLSPEGVSEPFAGAFGSRVLVGWVDERRVHLRALDGQGREVGRSSLWVRGRVYGRPQLLLGLDAASLAVRTLDDWGVAEIGANGRLGRRRVVRGAAHVGLLGAPLDDGLALFNLSDSVDDVMTGSYNFHVWQSAANAGFIPRSGGSPGWREVFKNGGDGSEWARVRMLTRPGAAGVFVTHHGGTASSGSAARFVPLRVPCP